MGSLITAEWEAAQVVLTSKSFTPQHEMEEKLDRG